MCIKNIYIFHSNVICYRHLRPRGIAESTDITESFVPILFEIKNKKSNSEYFIASKVLLQVTDKYDLHVP